MMVFSKLDILGEVFSHWREIAILRVAFHYIPQLKCRLKIQDMPTGDKDNLCGKSYGTLIYEAPVYFMVHLTMPVCIFSH